ncbi:MAG: zinc-dependent alcohol dehydrogenase family protein [Candidatus Thorarchaeota archaeon]
MKAVQYSHHGKPSDVVEIVDLDQKPLTKRDVRISLEVSAINPADLLAIQGLYPIRIPFPAIPGNEGVGRITEIGSEVTHLKQGDRVFLPFRTGIGAWQEEIVTSSDGLFAIPNKADPLQLAMASVNPPTAYFMLTKYITLSPGDWIIQNAANSAVGQYVITFAKSMGVKTINIVRRENVVEDLLNLGGDIVLVDSDDLAKRVSQLNNKAPVKLAFDGVAGDATHRLSQCLSYGGTIVTYGAMSLKRIEIGITQTIFKQIKLVGVWLQKWTQTAPPEKVKNLYSKTNEAVINGTVKTSVDTVYPIIEIKRALDHAMRENRKGKILLTGPAYK